MSTTTNIFMEKYISAFIGWNKCLIYNYNNYFFYIFFQYYTLPETLSTDHPLTLCTKKLASKTSSLRVLFINSTSGIIKPPRIRLDMGKVVHHITRQLSGKVSFNRLNNVSRFSLYSSTDIAPYLQIYEKTPLMEGTNIFTLRTGTPQHQCSSQEFQFWGPGAPTLQKVRDIWKNLGTVQSTIKIL